MKEQSFSFSSQVWQRLKKNKLAFAALILIILSFLVAFLGYVIAPDNTPNADLQTVEIQAKKPGYTQLFLQIPDKRTDPQIGLTASCLESPLHTGIYQSRAIPQAEMKF